jgi:DNA-binding beta-propeller fold protein YncE
MVTISRRRALAVAAAGVAVGLGGCAATDEPVRRQPPEAQDPLLKFWLAIGGGWLLEDNSPVPALGGRRQRVNFLRPTGVAARNNFLLVADAGARTIWRVDRIHDTLARLTSFTGFGPETGASLQMGNDFASWVALPAEHAVAQYDRRGQLVRRWASAIDAPRPVAVVVPEDRSRVLVGDGATARIVVFDPVGRPLHVLGGHQHALLQSITAMALGPGGLYVLDRIAQQVVVLDPRGLPVEVIGENVLVQPRALAVDASGRVFVSDDADQKIKVFRGGRLLASVGGAGAGPNRFGRIESMALDGNLLYVADSINARVQVLMVAPPSLEDPERRE